MSSNISRRTLVKGTAWATPAVVATAAVPAYAASTQCKASTSVLLGFSYDWGNYPGGTTNQSF